MPTYDALLNALLDMLASKTDYPQHINTDRVTSDLALVRWAAQCESQIGITPTKRREVAEAMQRLNTLVFDRPDAPVPDEAPAEGQALERNMAELMEMVGRWLERGGNA